MCLTPQPCGLHPTRLLRLWDSPGKNTRVVSYSLLQGIFLTQGSNPGLLHWHVCSLPLSHLGSPSLDVTWHKNFLFFFFKCPEDLDKITEEDDSQDTPQRRKAASQAVVQQRKILLENSDDDGADNSEPDFATGRLCPHSSSTLWRVRQKFPETSAICRTLLSVGCANLRNTGQLNSAMLLAEKLYPEVNFKQCLEK